MDFYPTLCELAGVRVTHEIDGKSLLPFLLECDETGLGDRTLFWVRREGGANRYQGRAYYAARRGPWKLEQSSPFAPMELYHLENDPLETTPVENQRVAAELGAALMQHIQKAGQVSWQRIE